MVFPAIVPGQPSPTLVGGNGVDLGTISTGTVTVKPTDATFQSYTNGGAHTLAPGSVNGSYLLHITSNASAGATTTGQYNSGAMYRHRRHLVALAVFS